MSPTTTAVLSKGQLTDAPVVLLVGGSLAIGHAISFFWLAWRIDRSRRRLSDMTYQRALLELGYLRGSRAEASTSTERTSAQPTSLGTERDHPVRMSSRFGIILDRWVYPVPVPKLRPVRAKSAPWAVDLDD